MTPESRCWRLLDRVRQRQQCRARCDCWQVLLRHGAKKRPCQRSISSINQSINHFFINTWQNAYANTWEYTIRIKKKCQYESLNSMRIKKCLSAKCPAWSGISVCHVDDAADCTAVSPSTGWELSAQDVAWIVVDSCKQPLICEILTNSMRKFWVRDREWVPRTAPVPTVVVSPFMSWRKKMAVSGQVNYMCSI